MEAIIAGVQEKVKAGSATLAGTKDMTLCQWLVPEARTDEVKSLLAQVKALHTTAKPGLVDIAKKAKGTTKKEKVDPAVAAALTMFK